MKNILTAPFMVEMIRTATNMYAHGWDERNGGNISLMLEENEALENEIQEKIDGLKMLLEAYHTGLIPQTVKQ